MVRLLLLIALIPGCAGVPASVHSRFPVLPQEISGEKKIAGTVIVRGTSRVMPGAVLIASPGTTFLFDPVDLDGDGVNDSRLLVEGVLLARGTPESPILFTSSAAVPAPGDWLEIRIDRSSGNVLEHCVVEYSRYGLHSHFSSGVVADSVFRKNIDGTRFGRARYYVLNNRFEGNIGKGINLRQSPLVVQGNELIGNRHGIFLFEKGGDAVIRGNIFDGNELSDLRFGDFFTGEPPLMVENSVRGNGGLRIVGENENINIKSISGAFPGPVGPRAETISLDMLWESSFDSFIDAGSVRVSSNQVASVTWGGDIIQQDLGTGRVLVHTKVPDIIDAQPVVWEDWLLFQAWDRKIRWVRAISGEVEGELEWPESPADDHRQAAPLLLKDEAGTYQVVFGLWNGELASVDPENRDWRWRVLLDGPVRSEPVYDGTHIWTGTDAGTLFSITENGKIKERIVLGSRIRARPAIFDENDIVVSTWDGRLIRIISGKRVWTRKLKGTGTYASPVVVKGPPAGVIAADGSGSVYFFDKEGVLLWETSTGSAVHVLALRAGMLWAGTESGEILAIRPDTGRVMNKITTGGAVHGEPLYDEGKIVVVSRDGKVRAFNIRNDTAPWEWK